MQEYDIAHSLDPNFTPIYNNRANAWSALGEPDKAMPQIAEAFKRSPLDPQLGIWYLSIGRAHLLLRHWDQAIDANLRAGALQKGFIYSSGPRGRLCPTRRVGESKKLARRRPRSAARSDTRLAEDSSVLD